MRWPRFHRQVMVAVNRDYPRWRQDGRLRALLPGGHLEPGDASLVAGSLRELEEETGIRCQQAPPADVIPVDIDLHSIPAKPGTGEPAHWHADFRYVFHVNSPEIQLQRDKVCDFAWRSPPNLPTERLAAKVAAKAA